MTAQSIAKAGAAIAATALLVGLLVVPAGAAETDPQIDLTVTKTDTMDPVQPGDTFEYPVTVTNNGPSGATQVFANDTLPAEVEFVSAAGQSCAFGGGAVSCDLGSMMPGTSKSFSITVQVRAGTPEGTFLNEVVVGTNEPDVTETNPDNNRAEEPTTVVLGSIGDTVWFDTNSNAVQDGGEAGLEGITVDLDGPGGAQSTETDADGKYLFDGLVRGDYVVTVTGPARHDATTPTTHTVALGMGEDYPDADFGFVQIDLELTKTVAPTSINPGESVTFTVEVINRGPGDATGVVVGDVLPAGLEYVSHSGDGFDATTFTWDIGSLPVGASASLSFVARDVGGPDSPGRYVNVAEVIAADQIDMDSDPNDGTGDDWDDAEVIVVSAQNLGDTVWYDRNENGSQDPGEPGIAGVRVTISGPGGTSTATTDSNGKYLLAVEPGTYTVTVDASTVVITDNGVTYSGINVTNTTSSSITAGVAVNVDNLAFDFGFDIILPPTGFTSGSFGVAGVVVLALGAGLLLLSRRGRRLLEDD